MQRPVRPTLVTIAPASCMTLLVAERRVDPFLEAIVINLESAQDRMEVMRAQLTRLGLPFTRLEAVTAARAEGSRSPGYWDTWERPLTDTERACLLSHIAAWQAVVDAGRPCLILEDDAILSGKTPALLAALETSSGPEHVTLEVRSRKKLISKSARHILPGLDLRRLYQDRSGAAAYVLWPAGARKLLEDTKYRAGLADAVICRAYNVESYQAEPACAVQMDRCRAYGLVPPIEPKSSIDGDTPVKPRGGRRFRLRRIAGQIRMGLRALRYSQAAHRRDVDLNPADFQV